MYEYELRRDGQTVMEFEASSDSAAIRRASVEGYSILEISSPTRSGDTVTVFEVA